MSYSSEDWRKAITNLIKMTSKKEVSWELTDIFVPDAWTVVDRSYRCLYSEKYYVVSSVRKKYFLDEEEFIWQSAFDFSVFDISLQPVRLASAPDALSVTESLFSVAEQSFAYASNALGDLL